MSEPQSPSVLLESSFRFCPRCGRPGPEIHHRRELRCGACGLRFFFNTAAAAGAFVFAGTELLLCVRSHDPGQGLLDVPGGFIEYDESIEEGLRREIAEELSIEVTAFRYLTSAPNDYCYAGIPYKTADIFYTCAAINPGALRPADDVAAILRVEPGAVDLDSFAFASTRRAFSKLLCRLNREERDFSPV